MGVKRGFTILEILVVMAVMGILMGVGVGYLQSMGQGSRSDQSRAILRETLYACKQSSTGGQIAIFGLREPDLDVGGPLIASTAVARPVLTANFETIDTVSSDYPVEVEGKVEIVPGGHTGKAAKFDAGGMFVFAPQSSFAVSEGIRIDVWLKPEGMMPTMTILEAEEMYELQLARDPKTTGYDVVLKLNLKSSGEGDRSASVLTEFRTKDGPIHPSRGWVHLQVAYYGWAPSIRIDGVERASRPKRQRAETTPSEGGPRRLAVPAGGAVQLRLSNSGSPYMGLMDTLVLGGVFRSSESEREIFGFQLVRPPPPVRIVFRDGRLDATEHRKKVVLRLRDEANPEGSQLEFRVGLYGTIGEELVLEEGAR